MPMALRSDVVRAARVAGRGKPVDLVHLSSLTMGDRDLEREVLCMFLAQADAYLGGMAKKAGRQLAAHSLKGAARGIGAWELAELAAAAEEGKGGKAAGTELRAEMARVCAYIRTIV